MKNLVGILLGLTWVSLLGACGGDDGGGSCASAGTCGGDVVGRWTVTNTCIRGAVSADMDTMCKDAKIVSDGLRLDGTYEFKSDRTYAVDAKMNGTMNMTFPASCLQQGSSSLTCDQLGAFFAAFGSTQAGLTVTCKGSSTCSCAFTFKDAPSKATGTYSTSNGKLTMKSSSSTSSTGETDDYCVQGNTLRLSPTSSMAMGATNVSGLLELQRQ
jgi:hypothetical protein